MGRRAADRGACPSSRNKTSAELHLQLVGDKYRVHDTRKVPCFSCFELRVVFHPKASLNAARTPAETRILLRLFVSLRSYSLLSQLEKGNEAGRGFARNEVVVPIWPVDQSSLIEEGARRTWPFYLRPTLYLDLSAGVYWRPACSS